MADDMMTRPAATVASEQALSVRSRAILAMIAAGHSYDQILLAHPGCTYHDIFAAAGQAIRISDGLPGKAYSMDEVRKRHARAYEKWTVAEEEQLRDLLEAGETVARIAGRLQRKRSAIRSRISKLALFGLLSPKEQARFLRCEEGGGPEIAGDGVGVGNGK